MRSEGDGRERGHLLPLHDWGAVPAEPHPHLPHLSLLVQLILLATLEGGETHTALHHWWQVCFCCLWGGGGGGGVVLEGGGEKVSLL